ncbi:MAG TPA: TonB-dependent receptor [Luteimonas sp.]|nr:TonB-dependent receptor [Luteimonas sp.]
MSQHHQRLFRRTALGLALGLCFSAGVQAQTNTAGAVAGRAAAGDTITIENAATGFSRTITVGGDGNYRLSQIPIGQYTITRKSADGATSTRTANVSVGIASNVDFVTSSGDAQTLDTVTVIGTGAVNPIDITSVESTTILTAQQIAKIPVARDATSVALLAPGTVRGDAAFGNLASFGGSSVAENQYYVNGFNITNSFQNLNFAQIPFEAVAEQQIKTGGYGAEFGRSLGGVINMITKRGTNEFHAGGNVFYEPEDLTEATKNVYQENGVLRQDNSKDSTWNTVASVWASGALVKDKLFAYGLVQYGRTETDTWNSVIAATNTSAVAKNPNWLLKMDWNISDNHLLELTAFSDKTETDTEVYRNTVGQLDRTSFLGMNFTETGGENYVLKYTGYLTDTFTLSALFGHGEFSRSQYLRTADGREVRYGGNLDNPASGCPIIADARPAYRRALNGTRVSTCNITGGAIARQDSGDERDQYRIDAEWQLGDHLLRFGYDVDNFQSTAGTSIEGGRAWRYATRDPDGIPNNGDEFDIVREQITNQGATVEVKQRAFYIQDSWNITDNFIAYLGARWDSFENLNGQGATYAKIDNQFGPRLGFSWDVFGDSTFKVFGNAGRYALPLTATVAIRGASASLFSRENFNFTGFDPVTGAPTGLTSMGDFIFINGEFGSPKNAQTIASKNLDPMYQDEYILGFQKTLGDHFTLGMRGIFRDLKAAIDDTCDYTAILETEGFTRRFNGAGRFIGWADANDRFADLPNSGFPYCRLFNPGADSVFLTDLYGDGQLKETRVPGSRLSPKAKRTYTALEFFFDANWDKFFMQGSYTYAKSKGNTEGGVKSDIGQADTGTTQDFDYPELTVDSFGYLPNDRRHSIKLFGNYQITDEWSVGGNFLVQSGRPKNCLGVLELPDGSLHAYGSSFFRCNGVPTPRGTEGRLPWTRSLDLNVAYKPAFAKGLQFKLDIFNVFNSQEVTAINEQVEDPSTGSRVETANLPLSFQAPRSVRFMVQYDF